MTLRTLVTGAAGFTGQYVAAAMAEFGHEVHGLVRDRGSEPIEGVAQVHEADLADLPSLERVVRNVRPDHVIHLAAVAFVAHEGIEQMYRANVVGARQLLEALKRTPAAPASVVLASSANIYGNAREGMLDETVPPAPANDYGVSKVAMEYVARLYARDLPIIVTRPFNYTGRGQDANFVIPKIVAHSRERKKVLELGNLEVARDFSDVRTVADAYARLLSTPAAVGGTYNIASGEAVSLAQVLELVSKISGHDFEIRVNPAFVRANEVRHLCGSASKLESVIGPLRRIPLEETLRWMLES